MYFFVILSDEVSFWSRGAHSFPSNLLLLKEEFWGCYFRNLSKLHLFTQILIHSIISIWHFQTPRERQRNRVKVSMSTNELPNSNTCLQNCERHLKVFQCSSLGLPSYQATACFTTPTLFLCLVQHELNVCISTERGGEREASCQKHYKGRFIHRC